jgi:SAM-dependent MidA family methyltransferase
MSSLVGPLDELVAARIRAEGPLPFAEVMRVALYDPTHGFYSTGGVAGRRGDFITSAEVGPLFGAVVARALDDAWLGLDRPGAFMVVEAGAGTGSLAVAVRAAAPACLGAGSLRYVLVEQSPALRARHAEHLPLGESFVSAPDVADESFTGVVLANELLDNLPVRLLERAGGSWHEVFVEAGAGGRLAEVLGPVTAEVAVRADALVPGAADLPDGARIPLADEAAAWVTRARSLLNRGQLILFDYGDTTASMATRPATDWLRTYRGHERGSSPLDGLGTQDVTVEVPVDQLAGFTVERQADWLRRHGIDELVEEGRRQWHERAQTDLAAVRARSRVHEAEALLDPAGLGAFLVLTLAVV